MVEIPSADKRSHINVMNKIIALLVIFLWFPRIVIAGEFEEFAFDQAQIDNADNILWLTPTRRGIEREYVLSNQLSDQHLKDLKQRFSKMKIGSDIDTYFMDSGSELDGYLIFMKNGAVGYVLKVEPHVSNYRSVRLCRWIINNDGFIVIYRLGEMLQGLISVEEYRSLLPRFRIPTEPSKKQLFKVYVASPWSNRFEHEE
jgi:hypothetical protein